MTTEYASLRLAHFRRCERGCSSPSHHSTCGGASKSALTIFMRSLTSITCYPVHKVERVRVGSYLIGELYVDFCGCSVLSEERRIVDMFFFNSPPTISVTSLLWIMFNGYSRDNISGDGPCVPTASFANPANITDGSCIGKRPDITST